MGLLDALLGTSNPVAQFADTNHNTLGAIGAGLGRGVNLGQGLGYAAQMVPQAAAADRSLNATAAWLEKSNPDLAAMVKSGALPPAAAFNAAIQMNTPIAKPWGTTLVNRLTGQPIGGSGTGDATFSPTSTVGQAWNILIKGHADPKIKASPEYQAAWAQVYQPKISYQNTPNGIMPIMQYPQVPADWAPNATGSANPVQNGSMTQGNLPPVGSAAPAGVPPATIGANGAPSPASASVDSMGISVGSPISGTRPFNESEARWNYLAGNAAGDLKTIASGFPALMNTKDQLLSKFGDMGRVLQDPSYKQASDAVTNAVSNILYVASGANLNAGEIQRKYQAELPSLGDDPMTVANKLDRLERDISGLAQQATGPNAEQARQFVNTAIPQIEAAKQQILGQSGGQGGSPVHIQGQQDYDALPGGTTFIGPDGKVRRKP